MDEIKETFGDKFDLFYLPIDYTNNCNLGFAFINFVDPMHIIHFFETYKGKKWRCFNSEKVCELAYAKYQGKKELVEHFARGNIMNNISQDKNPVILPTPDPLPLIELPNKYLKVFLDVYPNSSVNFGSETFCIESFYLF